MIFTVPRSNCLRFVDQNITVDFNHDSQLLQDQGRAYDNQIPYCQKYNIGDFITIQIVSDYTNATAKLYNYVGNTLLGTSSFTKVYDVSSTLKIWQCTIATGGLSGYYYVTLNASGTGLSTQLYKSDYFQVADFSAYPYISWRDSDYSGLYFGDASVEFGFRIEADIRKAEYSLETETFESFNSVVVNVNSKVKRVIDFRSDEIPLYIWEKLSLAASHRTFKINNVEYVCIGGIEGEEIDALRFSVKCKLQQATYEDYSDIQEAAGGVAPTPVDGYSPDGTDTYSPDGTNTYVPF